MGRNERLYFSSDEIAWFTSGDYFEIYRESEDEITVMSKNTGDFWDLTIFMNKIEIRHKHKLNHRYHKDSWYATDLRDAKRRIIKHDLYVLNDRKPIENGLLEHIIKFYGV